MVRLSAGAGIVLWHATAGQIPGSRAGGDHEDDAGSRTSSLRIPADLRFYVDAHTRWPWWLRVVGVVTTGTPPDSDENLLAAVRSKGLPEWVASRP